ncbi:MAG: hypothetical protein P8P15_09495, partial [Polaribacter sp.]|nr:hypothetical protein [Polaribacter sp.]
MKKNSIISQVFILLLTTNFVLQAQSVKKITKQKQPNFLFVLVDDQPFDALGLSKRYPFLKTPNIDRLAKEG